MGHMTAITDVLLITGPAGIGKSTLCWEIGQRLAAARVPHAIIETDELDRVFPIPTKQELDRLRPGTVDVSAANLAAMWSNYRALGHRRLIMSGVMVHLPLDRAWIMNAIPEAKIQVVRLRATERTLIERLQIREVGSGRDEQIERSLRQSRRMEAQGSTDVLSVPTDDRAPQDLAVTILDAVGWLPEPKQRPAVD
jgi:hypothetical protein